MVSYMTNEGPGELWVHKGGHMLGLSIDKALGSTSQLALNFEPPPSLALFP